MCDWNGALLLYRIWLRRCVLSLRCGNQDICSRDASYVLKYCCKPVPLLDFKLCARLREYSYNFNITIRIYYMTIIIQSVTELTDRESQLA